MISGEFPDIFTRCKGAGLMTVLQNPNALQVVKGLFFSLLSCQGFVDFHGNACEPSSVKKELDAYPLSILPSKTSPNYGFLKSIFVIQQPEQ